MFDKHLVKLVLLILALIIPDLSHSPYLEFSSIRPLLLRPPLYPSAPDVLQDLDSPAIIRKPLEILQAPVSRSTKELLQTIETQHRTYIISRADRHLNKRMQRLFMMFLQFETMSRLRFNRGTGRLLSQKDLEGLADYILQSRWYREALKRFSSSEIYGFSENHLLRILMAIHSGSHFFEVPYPTLFCLFFQESKLDFKVVSATGAKGIGQLTGIGLQQVQRLRLKPEQELKLQRAVIHLQQVYADPQIGKWLENLGFETDFPELGAVPETIKFTKISSSFIREMGRELLKNGQAYGKNTGLVWLLSKKIRRGYILPNRYAHAHGVFSRMLDTRHARSQASVYNIETNILLSAMLFNHYYRYRWRSGQQIFALQSDTRIMLAAAAYNHGQSGMRRYLVNLKNEFPMLDFHKLTSRKLRVLFTTRRLLRALQRPYRKIREASRHVRKVMECAGQRPLLF